MLYEQFLQPVRDSVDGDEQAAEQAVRATLQTLAERIGKDEALHVVPALPPQVAPWLYATGPAQGFDAAGFVERVARREGTPADVAERHASTVFTALGRALDDEAYRHLTARLPKTFAPLLPRGEFAGAVTRDTFLHKVAERAGLDDEDTTLRVTEAVLEALARRIGGEAGDLTVFLPVRLHPALRRGRQRPAPSLPAEEFLAQIAEQTRASTQDAATYARAVLTTVREVADDDEFFAVQVQLTPDYRDLLREP
jgi:uncharacterized protein (DUF2267 family)